MATVSELGKLVISVAKARGLKMFPIPEQQDEAADTLTRKKIKTRNDEDCRYVLKLCDAEQCVDDTFNNKSLMKQMVKSVIETLWEGMANDLGIPVSAPTDIQTAFAEAMKECMTENTLRQDTPRTRRTVTYFKRPG